MTEPFVGEIRLFGFDFAPQGWAKCDGTLLPVSQYAALYSLLSTMYGGDGRTTFGLPDLRGRVAISAGKGAGITYTQGQTGGQSTVTLTTTQMPQHAHGLTKVEAQLKCSSGAATGISPVDSAIAVSQRTDPARFNTADPDAAMKAGSVSLSGDTDNSGISQAHNNMEPYLVLNYCIALEGIYPTRN